MAEITREEQREKKRDKVRNSRAERRKVTVFPAKETGSKSDSTHKVRVCAYCRVSTDDPEQTTSYELQKKYYEEQILSKDNWAFAGIYADEGISGTSLRKRDEFNRMIKDCEAGKIDIILTKSVSRFARNVVDCISVVRMLAKLVPPVAVKFETEGFDSLDNTSEMILTVMAAAAQEESKTKSNSMNWSLERRFDAGNYLTPVLLGYDHDEEGDLVINEDEAVTVRYIFYSYLAGYPLCEIANQLTNFRRKTKLGRTKWSERSIKGILENERYCGDVLSWKTYTYDFWEHKKRKNRADRKQILDSYHHDGIVSHEVFDAVQYKIKHDKRARGISPIHSLGLVEAGALKGFVSVNRRWTGFIAEDYCDASESVYDKKQLQIFSPDTTFNDKKLEGYEIVRADLFNTSNTRPAMTVTKDRLSFNAVCMRKFFDVEHVEMLINTVEKCIAIRPVSAENPNSMRWGHKRDDKWITSSLSLSGFGGPLFDIMSWDDSCRYRLSGQYLSDGESQMLLFDLSNPEKSCICKSKIEIREEEHEETSILSNKADDRDDLKNYKEIFSWSHRTISYERIKGTDNWDILRPVVIFSYGGNADGVLVKEVFNGLSEAKAMMRCAV